MKDQKPARRRSPSLANSESKPLQNDATLGREIQSKIGEQLRAMYDEVVEQGVPDRFAELLKQLDKQGGGDRS
jgi:hypothetical protein